MPRASDVQCELVVPYFRIVMNISIKKYKNSKSTFSPLDAFGDALDLLALLAVEDFVEEKLSTLHNKSIAEAKVISKRIIAHADVALAYANLSLSAPPEISFLPGYYCILNMAKIQSLAGTKSHLFDNHTKWHGVNYSGAGKSSRGLLTDEITLQRGGALALFHNTMTGNEVTKKKVFRLRDVYSQISVIGSEYSLVSGIEEKVLSISFTSVEKTKKFTLTAKVNVLDYVNSKRVPYAGAISSIPCLKGFRKVTHTKNTFQVKGTVSNSETLEDACRRMVGTQYLLDGVVNDDASYCYPQYQSIKITEDMAIAMAFFHMSSVCRYNPEFLHKLSASKYWTPIMSLRRHALYKFLIGTWCFITQTNYKIQSSD